MHVYANVNAKKTFALVQATPPARSGSNIAATACNTVICANHAQLRPQPAGWDASGDLVQHSPPESPHCLKHEYGTAQQFFAHASLKDRGVAPRIRRTAHALHRNVLLFSWVHRTQMPKQTIREVVFNPMHSANPMITRLCWPVAWCAALLPCATL